MADQHHEYDLLQFNSDPVIKGFTRDEPILFSDKIKKTNHYGFSQERNIIITDKAVYNLKGKSMKRRFQLSCIKGITMSKITDEFIIHCNDNEYDYQYNSGKKKTIIEIIAKYYYIQTQKELELHELDTRSLSTFVTTKKEKKKDVNISRMPVHGKISVAAYVYGTKTQAIVDTKSSTIKKTGKIITNAKVSMEDFNVLKTIGRGSCGKILLVKYKKTGDLYAIKDMRKDQLVSENTTDSILLEKEILSSIDSPFLLSMSFFFQSPERIYYVTPYIPGGDLYRHLKEKGKLEESTVKLYTAQIGIALDSLHAYNIVYRDVKPENILIDEDGYLKLCDFGAAVHLKGNEKEYTYAGSPEYASPEMISGEGHNIMTDWWSFGILLYELLFGKTPFYNVKETRMFELIQMEELKFPKDTKASNEVKDLIRQLLVKNPNNRLGREGWDKIKAHPFYGPLNFDLIKTKKLKINFKPDISEEENPKNFEEEFLNMPTAESPVSEWVHDYSDWFNDFVKNADENEE